MPVAFHIYGTAWVRRPGRAKALLDHGRHDVVRREDHVPAGVAAEDAGEHLLVGLVDGVADPDAELGGEVADGLGRHVARPVEDVEAGPGGGAAEGGERADEGAALHDCCSLSTMAFTKGLGPRGAVASNRWKPSGRGLAGARPRGAREETTRIRAASITV
jgi:hypothetical protein